MTEVWKRTLLMIACCAGGALCLGGCRAGGKETEADRLRRQVLEQEKSLARLEAERDELAAKLGEIERVRLTGGEVPADVLAAMPRCASVSIGSLSGLVDSDGVPGYDAVDLTVVPRDGRERFVQVAGRLFVRADVIPPASSGGEGGPVMLGTLSLDPGELREAYRSSPLGTHYAVRLPLSPPNRPLEGTLALSIEFHDGLTGRVLTARTATPVPAPPPSR